jgi:hypothetical protein
LELRRCDRSEIELEAITFVGLGVLCEVVVLGDDFRAHLIRSLRNRWSDGRDELPGL